MFLYHPLSYIIRRSSYDDFAFHLHTNTIGPIICAQRLIKSGISIGKIVFISSDSGSAQSFRDFEDGFAAYAASKAALNQMLRHMAAELKRKGSDITVLALHPGEVATDMAKTVDLDWEVEGQLAPSESVAACIPVINGKTIGDTGTFWTWEDKVWRPVLIHDYTLTVLQAIPLVAILVSAAESSKSDYNVTYR